MTATIARKFARRLGANLLVAATVGTALFGVHVHDMTHRAVDPRMHQHVQTIEWAQR